MGSCSTGKGNSYGFSDSKIEVARQSAIHLAPTAHAVHVSSRLPVLLPAVKARHTGIDTTATHHDPHGAAVPLLRAVPHSDGGGGAASAGQSPGHTAAAAQHGAHMCVGKHPGRARAGVRCSGRARISNLASAQALTPGAPLYLPSGVLVPIHLSVGPVQHAGALSRRVVQPV